MRKIRITNNTHWQTKHLRAIAARALAMVLEPEQGLHVSIEFRYTRGLAYSSGCAHLNSNHMTVRLSKHERNRKDLAMVVAHEAAHAVLGWHHDVMRGNSYFHRVGLYDELYAWADTMPLEVVAPKKKVRKTAGDKLAKCEAALARWERKRKLAETKIKIWKRKAKYYGKQLSIGSGNSGSDEAVSD